MMNNTLKSPCNVSSGTVIEGKWHRQQYKIIRRLGVGATGIVYLARHNNKYVALKMSEHGMSVTSEVNVLKSLKKVQGSFLGPSLLDVDDWMRKERNIPFYVMEYIHGPDLLTFVKEKGHDWTIVLILQLLTDLQHLHQIGWIFGDLKPENLIVTGPPPRIRCIDVGGTTMQGRAIKEYTEFFDRGYWRLGTRKAEPAYDLFAVAMIMINLAYPNRFHKKEGGLEQLTTVIQQHHQLQRYGQVIRKALQGQYCAANEMRNELLNYVNKQTDQSNSKRRAQPLSNKRQSKNNNQQNNRSVKQSKKVHFVETALILLVVSLFYAIYLFGQVM